MAAVEISDLVVRYRGGPVAVDGLSLSAEPGCVLALLGPNGAGKTSTLEVAEGYRRPTAGSVRVLGLDPWSDRRRLLPRMGVMLQSGGIYPGIRPLEALRLFASFHGDPTDPEALLERVGLSGVRSRPYRRLSGGEKQRLSLALALVGRPEVALLDEPSAGVDVEGRQLVRDVIGELRVAGACVLLATHELAEAEAVADRVAIVGRGRLLAEGSPAELAAEAAPPTISFSALPGLDVSGLAARLGLPVREHSPGRYRVEGAASMATMAQAADWLDQTGVAVSDLRAGTTGLEDVFLRLTADQR